MFRKLIVVAAAIAMPVSIVAVSGGMAGASNPHTAAADGVSCTGITGTLSFSPKPDAAGYKSGKIATKVAATLSGCKVTGSTPITITKGVVSGTINGAAGTASKPTGKCTGLSGNGVEVGNLTVAWTASGAARSPTRSSGSRVTTAPVPGDMEPSPSRARPRARAAVPSWGRTTAAKDKSVAETVLTSSAVLSTCVHSGLSSLKIQAESGKAALTLG